MLILRIFKETQHVTYGRSETKMMVNCVGKIEIIDYCIIKMNELPLRYTFETKILTVFDLQDKRFIKNEMDS